MPIQEPDETNVPAARDPDPFGQAALLLVESLIHGLIARSALTAEEAVEIITVAIDVKTDVAAEFGDSPATMLKSLELLKAISMSLMQDLSTVRA
jgi:hypothetical protein